MHDGMVLPDLSRSCKACVWQAQNAAAAAAEEAGAEAQHSTQLQEQLQDTKAGCTSLAVALSSEQVARTKAEQQAAECQQRARDQTALMASLALQQNKAIQVGAHRLYSCMYVGCLHRAIVQLKARWTCSRAFLSSGAC